ncbi:MAG: VOC family protein [Oscillospiraceae bacterium]|nr:VOC family protein [Oscillospiraceae bacterium]
MITKFRGLNISSKDPKRLALFYQDILGFAMLDSDPNYDGVTFGNHSGEPMFWIWDENNWGKANTGTVTLVFDCDDHDATYRELKQKGVVLDPPKTASWGGKELFVKDPDGNTILIL